MTGEKKGSVPVTSYRKYGPEPERDYYAPGFVHKRHTRWLEGKPPCPELERRYWAWKDEQARQRHYWRHYWKNNGRG